MTNRRFTLRCVSTLAAALLAACSVESPTQPLSESPTTAQLTQQLTARHVFVLTTEGDEPSPDLLREIDRRGGRVDKRFDAFGVLTVLGLDDDDAALLARRRDVDGVDRDMIVRWVPGFDESAVQTLEGPSALTDQSGAFFFAQGMQWNMTQILANQAWVASGQGEGTTVAVLDTGGDPFHIDLSGKYLAASTSVLTPGSSPCGAFDEDNIFDLNFHGTFVSGLVSSNGLAMASVAPDASILAVKVLNCSGSGSFADIIDGITYAAEAGADVINMSLGAYFSRSEPGATSLIHALQRAVRFADNHGSLVVASSGNDGINLDEDGDFINVPSQLNRVLSVGATAPVAQMDFDALATYTNYGHTGVDLMAPGGDLVTGGVCGFAPDYRCDLVLSAYSSFLAPGANFYVLSGGTSFSSPLVAGAAAVVASTHHSPVRALGNCLMRGADDLGAPGTDAMYGHGRLNVMGALRCSERGSSSQ